jgi:uncharacterized membrane protein
MSARRLARAIAAGVSAVAFATVAASPTSALTHGVATPAHAKPGTHSQPPQPVSDASQILNEGVYRALPDVPGALVTTHTRNNNRGQTVGAYVDHVDANGVAVGVRGFLMSKSGKVTRIGVPGAVVTLPLGVNDRGQVVGSWVGPDERVNPATGELGPIHGFVWDDGEARVFDVPGSTSTAAYEINNHGWVVGNFTDANFAQHSYILRHGEFTTIDHPRAATAPNSNGTKVFGLNDRGRLVGSVGDEQGILHAWSWEKGRFTDLTLPGDPQAIATQVDNRGRIIGVFQDDRPKLLSFTYERGRYRTIEAAGRCDTAAYGLNERGQILLAAAGTTDGTTCPPQPAPAMTAEEITP